jgi:hypothetical protein
MWGPPILKLLKMYEDFFLVKQGCSGQLARISINLTNLKINEMYEEFNLTVSILMRIEANNKCRYCEKKKYMRSEMN